MYIHLYRRDKNWQKRGYAKNYNLLVNYEFRTYGTYENPFYGYTSKDDIEVKNKSDILDYIGMLKNSGFTETYNC